MVKYNFRLMDAQVEEYLLMGYFHCGELYKSPPHRYYWAMAKDFFEEVDRFFNDLYGTFTESRHQTGDSRLDHDWDAMDAGAGFGSDLDEFDRRMRDLGHKPREDGRGETRRPQQESGGRAGQERSGQQGRSESARPTSSADERILQLARDYRNLEIEPGLGRDEVRKAYKKVLLKYHPDRFANDPAKQATATQITAKLNESYQRIIDYLDRREGASKPGSGQGRS